MVARFGYVVGIVLKPNKFPIYMKDTECSILKSAWSGQLVNSLLKADNPNEVPFQLNYTSYCSGKVMRGLSS